MHIVWIFHLNMKKVLPSNFLFSFLSPLMYFPNISLSHCLLLMNTMHSNFSPTGWLSISSAPPPAAYSLLRDVLKCSLQSTRWIFMSKSITLLPEHFPCFGMGKWCKRMGIWEAASSSFQQNICGNLTAPVSRSILSSEPKPFPSIADQVSLLGSQALLRDPPTRLGLANRWRERENLAVKSIPKALLFASTSQCLNLTFSTSSHYRLFPKAWWKEPELLLKSLCM